MPKTKLKQECFLCHKTENDVDFIKTDINNLEAGWLWAPDNRQYCPICVRDRFDEIEALEGGTKE